MNTEPMHPDLELRPATTDDLPGLAEVHLAARRGAGVAFPPSVHSDAEVRGWVSGWDLGSHDVLLASLGGRTVGYSRSTTTWLDDLYVVPGAQGRGVGGALLDHVLAGHPDGVGLWVFESNQPARHFYARRGFITLERTDGSANESRAPDIKLVWPGRDPLRCLRAMIDEVDLLLGDVLARRTALTKAVQAVKPSTHRDPGREAEIARRVAAIAPELGHERVARIVDEIITQSLEASLA